MHIDTALPRAPGRWLTIGIVIGLHAALLLAWRHAREKAPARDDDTSPRIQWIETSTPKAAERTPDAPPPPATSARTSASASASTAAPGARQPRAAPAPRPAAPSPAVSVPAAAESEAPAITLVPPDPFAEPAPSPATPASGADAIRKRAFADLGKIDKDLRKQSLNKFATPDDSPQKRLIAGIQSARRNPTLFAKAEIEEITTGNNDGGARKYKIKTGLGTYCITYPSVNDPLGKKKYELCPK